MGLLLLYWGTFAVDFLRMKVIILDGPYLCMFFLMLTVFNALFSVHFVEQSYGFHLLIYFHEFRWFSDVDSETTKTNKDDIVAMAARLSITTKVSSLDEWVKPLKFQEIQFVINIASSFFMHLKY